MNKPRCRICLGDLSAREKDYHADCCRELFDAARPPQISYTWEELNSLAEQIVRSHIAVPGVQPKLLLHLEHGNARDGGRFTLVGLEDGYILKPPVERFPEMPELEHLTMRMAACCGIATASCGLISLHNGPPALIVRRMDRDRERKLAMEDMCQLTDRLTEEKYRGSLESAGKVILRHCNNSGLDAVRFFEVNLFCFLTGNSDMHLKNFSLLRASNGEISLSPAYDLLPTVLLLPEDEEESALTINGRKKKLRRGDFLALGQTLRMTDRQISNVFQRFEKSLDACTALIDCGFCSEETKERYRHLVSRRWQQLGAS
ncbi:MAG: HipA domain-containing protein [Chthoniobacterales bacterium]|nr:HipA domain-containing protein [Chthoniobacterales bacterium]